eukprot:jgi/Mesvir1/12109/Mv00374-RA.1
MAMYIVALRMSRHVLASTLLLFALLAIIEPCASQGGGPTPAAQPAQGAAKPVPRDLSQRILSKAALTNDIFGCPDIRNVQNWKGSECKSDRTGALFLRNGPRKIGPPYVALLPAVKPMDIHSDPSLAELSSGEIVCAWVSTVHDTQDTAVLVSHLKPTTNSWSRPRVVSYEVGRTASSPRLLYLKSEDTLHLWHDTMKSGSHELDDKPTRDIRHITFKNGGGEASVPQLETSLSLESAHMGGQITMTPTGKLLMPLNHVHDDLRREQLKHVGGLWTAIQLRAIKNGDLEPPNDQVHEYRNKAAQLLNVARFSGLHSSRDGGKTWEHVRLSQPGWFLSSPSIVAWPKSKHGSLVAFYTSNRGDYIHRSVSTDDGATWSVPEKLHLPNINSGIQAIVLSSGKIALGFVNAVAGSANRTHLNWPIAIALSNDGGISWDYVRDLEPGGLPDCMLMGLPRALDGKALPTAPLGPTFGHVSLIEGSRGVIHVAYSFRSASVKYVQITEQWVKTGPSIGAFHGHLSPASNMDLASTKCYEALTTRDKLLQAKMQEVAATKAAGKPPPSAAANARAQAAAVAGGTVVRPLERSGVGSAGRDAAPRAGGPGGGRRAPQGGQTQARPQGGQASPQGGPAHQQGGAVSTAAHGPLETWARATRATGASPQRLPPGDGEEHPGGRKFVQEPEADEDVFGEEDEAEAERELQRRAQNGLPRRPGTGLFSSGGTSRRSSASPSSKSSSSSKSGGSSKSSGGHGSSKEKDKDKDDKKKKHWMF